MINLTGGVCAHTPLNLESLCKRCGKCCQKGNCKYLEFLEDGRASCRVYSQRFELEDIVCFEARVMAKYGYMPEDCPYNHLGGNYANKP